MKFDKFSEFCLTQFGIMNKKIQKNSDKNKMKKKVEVSAERTRQPNGPAQQVVRGGRSPAQGAAQTAAGRRPHALEA